MNELEYWTLPWDVLRYTKELNTLKLEENV